MSKSFSAFYDHLLPELPGCTTALVDVHLLQVARDFCTRSIAWREPFEAIASLPDTLSYLLITPEARSELVKPLRLTVNLELLWAAVDPRDDQDQPRFAADTPPFSIDSANEQITLDDQPAGDIVLEGALRPMLSATTLPNFLLADYLEAMRTGTLARLMAMGRKHWSDREMAAFYAGEYAKHVAFAANKSASGNTRKPLRTRPY